MFASDIPNLYQSALSFRYAILYVAHAKPHLHVAALLEIPCKQRAELQESTMLSGSDMPE